MPFRVLQRPGQSGTTHVYVDLDKEPDVWCFFRSDVHHDSVHCLRVAESLHLEVCRQRNAHIFDFGDAFCAMQSKFDKRSSKSNVRQEHQRNDYLDALVSETAKDYRSFARQFAFLGRGNHETSVLDKCGVDLTNRLAEELREEGSPCVVGCYQGWILFHFRSRGTRAGTYAVRHTHGYGGGGPVTKDAIQFNRQLVFIENADMLVSGHTHDKWHIKQEREYLADNGRLRRRVVDGLKLGTYLDAYAPGDGWSVERGHPPRSVGGWWLRFYQTSGREPHFYWRRQILDADDS